MKSSNKLTLVSTLLALAAAGGCTDEDILQAQSGDIAPNPGTVTQKHFNIVPSTLNPNVLNTATNVFTKTDVEITVSIGDRFDAVLTDVHTIFFRSEYGLIDPSCTTSDGTGSCTVKWTAIKRPETGGPGDDGFVDITAYTLGEESFTDINDNGTYDDGETFTDLPEPFIDVDNDGTGIFNAGDYIIDVVNTRDTTGSNGAHDTGDLLFNGLGCTHSTNCSSRRSITIFDQVTLTINY